MVELSEISAVLRDRPQVRAATAITVRQGDRDLSIGVVELSESVSGPLLRQYAWRHLGPGSGPDGVLAVDSLPADEAGLDAGRITAALANGECTLFEPPRDEIETRLVSIWNEALETQWLGVRDDFLELGGDSLTALNVIIEIEREFGISLDVFEFMNHPCVRGLADLVRKKLATMDGVR